MTRRTFFAALAGVASSLALPWAAFGRSKPGLCPPVEFLGNWNDPRYFYAGLRTDHHDPRKEGRRCYVDGVDRQTEAYECFTGEDGWANLYLKRPDEQGKLRMVWTHDHKPVCYSVRGKVEFR
jgi:hypothetical protein